LQYWAFGVVAVMTVIMSACADRVGDTEDLDTMDDSTDTDEPIELFVGSVGPRICALSKGRLRCWGRGEGGRLGYGDEENIGDDELPSDVGDLPIGGTVVTMDHHGQHRSCALLTDHKIRCWGLWAAYGENTDIGDDETVEEGGWDIDLGEPLRSVAVGAASCALTQAGDVRCWGLGNHGRLGYGNTEDIEFDQAATSAGPVALGEPAIQIDASTTSTCAVLESGRVRCWGEGRFTGMLVAEGDVGDDETPESAGFVDVGAPVSKLSMGKLQTCALTQGGAVRCWGGSVLVGSCGHGSAAADGAFGSYIGDDETPASLGDLLLDGVAVDLACGDESCCAIMENGDARCWGRDPEIQKRFEPGPPLELGGPVLSMAVGKSHWCAVLEDGVHCWGYGSHGQLGYGNTNDIPFAQLSTAGVVSIFPDG